MSNTTSEQFRDEPYNVQDAIIEVRGATVSFDMERGQSRVLDDVDLDIQRDEILGVVGESGSGKSMFAEALLDAIVEPGVLEGEILYKKNGDQTINILELNDDELRSLRWEEISMVFQGVMNSFNPVYKIRKHFIETLKAHDYDIESGLERARELMRDLYLQPDRVFKSYPHELSGGMKQRTLIALSLVLDPNVLVMDEPTAALDLLMQRSILNLLNDLQQKYDLTIIFITHDLPLVAGIADRLAVMYAFEIVEVGPADEIVHHAAHPYTRALLNAVPNTETALSEMEPIEGSSPDPINIPEGCSYHPRCPLSDEQCRTDDPVISHTDNQDHAVACFYWNEVADTIPMSIGNSVSENTVHYEQKQSTEPVVSLEDVSVHFEVGNDSIRDLFKDSDIVQAVNGVSLDIYENDVVALVGESGCGKTTLGETALGIQRPTEGTVKYREQDIWLAKHHDNTEIPFSEIRQSLQLIQQDPGGSLNPNRTVRASLSEPLKHWQSDLSRKDREARILGLIEYVGMSPPEDYASRYPHQLSGGEQQRVALIRALLMNPDFILADEAVSALDVSLRVEVMDLMHELQDVFGTSYLFISHDLANARYFAGKVGGRIGVMYLGEIVEIGPAEEIINNPKHPYTKVLVWSTADLELDDPGEPPVRGIDIPDPVDPPSGCRFHTRCPEAREICAERIPEPPEEDTSDTHTAACFREYPAEHSYWDSQSITENEPEPNSVGDND